ncbi:MAG: hypothetical protein KDC90_14310, partial [Ignavibacteriae bacterium]|nr:hypothetical protein [Ignavibacteriota bacterium]
MIKKYLILFFVISSAALYSQVSNVRLDNNVYDYLSRLSQKGIIQYEDLVKPHSRRYIASRLIEARERINKLTSLQKDELEFYEKEFGFEIEKLVPSIKHQISRTENQVLRTHNQESGIQYPTASIQAQDTAKKRDLFDKS